MSLPGVTVAASVVIMDWLNIEDGLRCLEGEKTDFLHFDIMDGYFVADFTMGSVVVESIRQGSSIAAEFHAMVEEPRRVFSCFTPREAEVFMIHYEASRNLHRDIVTLRKLGFRPGVVLNPQTPLESVEYVLGELHRVTILATHPGFDDHIMASETIEKVKILQEWKNRSNSLLNIAIDGGYTIDAVSDLASAGANHFVVGSSTQVKEAGSLQAAVRAVRIAAS